MSMSLDGYLAGANDEPGTASIVASSEESAARRTVSAESRRA
jgi:hypothetical protein